MKKVVTLGTLREDIVIEYDFSIPLNKLETELIKMEKSIGGSVHNTCYFLASYDPKIEVVLCTLNYFDLVELLKKRIQCDNYSVLTTSEAVIQSPLSIIGLKNDGEKQMISYDPAAEIGGLVELFEKEAQNAELIYTSFYEINERNYGEIARIFSNAICAGKTIMLDLCPLLSRINDDILRTILSNTTIISGNENEFRMMTDRMCQGQIKKVFEEFSKIEKVYVKKGSKGASLYTINALGIVEESFVDADSMETIENTTGCGDVFNAVLIDSILSNETTKKGLEHAVYESGRIAKGGLPWIKK